MANVRNFWIDADIDGRATHLSGGPSNRGGGFQLRIYMRDDGESKLAYVIEGMADSDVIALKVWNESENKIVHQIKGRR